MLNADEQGKDVALVDVLRAFLTAERGRSRYKKLRCLFTFEGGCIWSILHGLASKDDLHILRRAVEHPESLEENQVFRAVSILGEYGSTRIPLIPFTVGSSNDDRRHIVAKWVLREVKIGEFWMPRINEDLKELLKDKKFNLAAAASEFPDNWKQLSENADGVMPVIGLEKSEDGVTGSIQLLDGAHRVVALKNASEDKVKAFIGIRKSSP